MDHKLKKKLLIMRIRRVQIAVQHAEQHRQETEATRHEEENLRQSLKGRGNDQNDDEPVWSARTQEIRNRLTGKKRMAKERWNRFAGTSGGGGVGR